MKLKSKLFMFFAILCILFSITCVFASDNSTDTLSYDVESNMDLKIDNYETIQESPEDDEDKSFTDLEHDLDETSDIFDVENNYTFKEGDPEQSITVHKENLVINGNNHVFDGGNISTGLAFEALNDGDDGDDGGDEQIIRTNIIINDLTLRNFQDAALAIYDGNLTLNNVNFTFSDSPAAMLLRVASNSTVTLNNCNFHSNTVENMISIDDSLITINNTNFYNNNFSIIIRTTYSNILINNSNFNGNYVYGSVIEQNRGQLRIEKSKFDGMSYKKGGIISYKGDFFTIKACEFLNSHADLDGGAIIAKFFPVYDYDTESYIISGEFMIEDCIFRNLSTANDGGAIYFDMDSGSSHIPTGLNVINSNFTECSSAYGGAIAVQGAKLNVEQSNFINNSATVYGGALYTTWSAVTLTDTVLSNNSAERNGGAIYFDKGTLTLNRTNLSSNKAVEELFNAANAIYANDVEAIFTDSSFNNGGVSVYANFASDSKLENVTKNDDVFLMDNKDYIVSIETEGVKLELVNNSIIVDTLPSKFDARDWGWVTPEKYQGDNYDCWAFATVASLETALIKSTGNTYNLSQNYIQKLQLKYYPIGDIRNSLTGFAYSGLGHALSWIGILPMDAPYDDRGLILEANPDDARIHLQDAIFIPIGIANHDELIKRAVLEYGAVSVQLILTEQREDIPTSGDNISITDHSIHFVSIIGWDDNYTDLDVSDEWVGAWITKDSEDGFNYEFYEDTSLWDVDKIAIIPQSSSIVYLFNNTIDYHVNYQTDLTGLAGFDANYTYYSNEFTSKYSELIGAVGTYFNESGIPYSFDVYVNGKKVLTQSGVSEFAGFRTIILNKYIPVKAGDKFKVVFKNNNLPYQAYSRQHYIPGMSLVSADGKSWSDITLQNKTVCLKVYTVVDNSKIASKDMTMTVNDGSYFTVTITDWNGERAGAGEEVKFTINGKTFTALTDANGIAKLKITQKVGTYTITTSYLGSVAKNTIKINPAKITLKAKKSVKVKKTAKKFVLSATLKINGKAAKGKVVKFKFRGKTYKAKTNKKGVAKVTINKKVIRKLKAKKYTVKIVYSNKSVKTTVNVKKILSSKKTVTVKKSAKKLVLKARLKDGKKALKKKKVTFKFRGKKYKAKTNKKGIAKVTIKKKLIKKLKSGKKYTVSISYLNDWSKTIVKVKR